MFESRIRPILITQYEHERLAGAFARLWGNADFSRPALPFDAFVQGVALHDWHYGVIDNLPIGGANEDDWLKLVTQGVGLRFEDPVTDIIAKLHIRRLLSGQDSPQRQALVRQVDARVAERLPETGFTRDQFTWADRITRFCDHLAFDFSFEAPTTGEVGVFARPIDTHETLIRYEILPAGQIRVDPWPFSVDSFSGNLVGYQREGYPGTLTPLVVPFSSQKRA